MISSRCVWLGMLVKVTLRCDPLPQQCLYFSPEPQAQRELRHGEVQGASPGIYLLRLPAVLQT